MKRFHGGIDQGGGPPAPLCLCLCLGAPGLVVAEYHRNRLGYSIGINYPPDWGEGELISLRQGEHRELRPGMTFHMPPLCLKYREFGIGFSETIVVTETGCEQFSKLPREVIVKNGG